MPPAPAILPPEQTTRFPLGSCITCVVMPVKYSIVKDQTSSILTEDAENHPLKRFRWVTFGFSGLDVTLVGLGRFELPTSPLSGVRSNQLSYRPKICWWSWSGSNRRPPECKSGALPAELQPLTASGRLALFYIRKARVEPVATDDN